MQLHSYNCNSDTCVIKKKNYNLIKKKEGASLYLDVIKKLIKINIPKNI